LGTEIQSVSRKQSAETTGQPQAELGPAGPAIDKGLRRRVARHLLAWFRRYRRTLPWRRDRDPYRIWVSEVMLQQTQVATVIDHFERFLRRFPTLDSLATADEQEVLSAWEGLGYYRRARDLHRAARHLALHHRGQVPDDPAVLRELPGVGRYILGAVLSQAFDRCWPIVEANSERVLCRLLGQQQDLRRGPVRRWLWQMAEELLPARRVGDFNQALMELGALVCTPAAPRCAACPLTADCQARHRGLQDELPARSQPLPSVRVQEAAVVVRRGPRAFLVQRPDRGRWAGMWEFPHGSLAKGETHEAASRRLLAELTGLRADLGPELLTVRHAVTRFHITMVCFQARFRGGKFRSDFYRQGQWVEADRLADFPVSVPQRRVAQALAGIRQHTSFE
jgi:A/G-specific adenine glycosylase